MDPVMTLDRRDGDVAVLTIDRPHAHNTLNAAVVASFAALWEQCEDRPDVRAVVVTGAGSTFSAGGDIAEFRPSMTSEEFAHAGRSITDLLSRVEHSALPSVAAINGTALGGGLEIALACDLRIAAAGAALGLPEIRLGFLPGGGGTVRLGRLVPEAIAKQMLMTGQSISADEAWRVGLVNEVRPDPPACLDRAVEVAAVLASMPPLALGAAKRLVGYARTAPIDEAIVAERAEVSDLFGTTDRVEGVAAFFAKRRPRFRGE